MYPFFAFLDRLRLIRRWGLMRNTLPENDMEHSAQTAMIAHGLAVLAKARYQRPIDPEHVLALALYHDASEVITGDLPTPVKYMNPAIQDAYRAIESSARERLTQMLPGDMRPAFAPCLTPDESTDEWRLVKAADRISAYLKCLAEEKVGNGEFARAKAAILESIERCGLPEVRDFMKEFVPSFGLSPDELSQL